MTRPTCSTSSSTSSPATAMPTGVRSPMTCAVTPPMAASARAARAEPVTPGSGPRSATHPCMENIPMNDASKPTTVPMVDLQRYLGTWYEIARLPMRQGPEDYTDITATYSLTPKGTVAGRNRARDGKGEPQESVGEATVVEGSGNAKLEVSFLPDGLRWIPFTKGDYWI